MSTRPVFQTDLWGNTIVGGDVVDRIIHILEQHEDARNDYRILMARYWLTFDGLAELLDKIPGARAAFLSWFQTMATNPKTLQNRCMEIQRLRPDLEAAGDVREQREHQRGAPPRDDR